MLPRLVHATLASLWSSESTLSDAGVQQLGPSKTNASKSTDRNFWGERQAQTASSCARRLLAGSPARSGASCSGQKGGGNKAPVCARPPCRKSPLRDKRACDCCKDIADLFFPDAEVSNREPCPISCTGFTIISTTSVSNIHNDDCSAAWSACHLKHVVICLVSSDILKCRLLK